MSAHTDHSISRFAAIVGAGNALTEPADQARYLEEPRGLWHGRAALVLRPGSSDEVSKILALANETSTAIVPQGGNTGLVGGQMPDESGTQIVLSLERLNRIRAIDPETDSMTAEAGVILADAQAAAEKVDRLFPLSLAAEGSCRIGGNLATNAGGTGVLAYGSARDLVLGLEVVLADGRIWNGLRALRKDNTGYDLKHVFIGSEGTLGIITAAVLKLFPRPRSRAVGFAGVADPEAALKLFTTARARAGQQLVACELISRLSLEFALRHGSGAGDPLDAPHPWYVLVELASAVSGADMHGLLEAVLVEAHEAGAVSDATIAASETQAIALWRLRELLSETQRPEGGSIKHDASVPIGLVPEFISRATAAVERLVPGCRPVAFGHLGDGNVHFNVSQPVGADTAAFLARWEEVAASVHDIVLDLGGSISAEHGIGQLKRGLMEHIKDPVELDLMRGLKRTLDPKGILNPGKVL